jgi:predicted transcriptional regulator
MTAMITTTTCEDRASSPGLYSNDFSLIFSKLLEGFNVTCYQISKYTHISESYLSRLKSGEKDNPTVETVMKISLALAHFSNKIGLYDIEALFNSVGRSIRMHE